MRIKLTLNMGIQTVQISGFNLPENNIYPENNFLITIIGKVTRVTIESKLHQQSWQ